MMANTETLWKKGQIAITTDMGEELYTWEVYDEGSSYGINGGRVSKLEVRRNGVVVCNYDREWDLKPKSYAVVQVVNYITNVVYGSTEPSVHKDFIFYLINDWLEVEDEEISALQNKVCEVGVEKLYELYMYSEENICSYDDITELIDNLLGKDGNSR